MGVLRGLSRVFRAKDIQSGPNSSSTTAVLDADGTVAIDLHDPFVEADPGIGARGAMSKKDVIVELQRNYTEVLDLVRKVDGHLDLQEQRAQEMMALAERTAGAVEALPEIQRQNGQLVESVDAFTQAVRGHQSAVNESIDRQASAIEDHTHSLNDFNRQVRDSIGGMSDTTDRLGDAIAQMREADLRRERELSDMVMRSQRGMLAIVITSAVLVAGTLIALLLFVLR